MVLKVLRLVICLISEGIEFQTLVLRSVVWSMVCVVGVVLVCLCGVFGMYRYRLCECLVG